MENPFDETSAFDTVFLSTRITQIEHDMLNEIWGWLQTTNQTATIRKQEVIRRTIRMAHEYLQTQIAHMDKLAEEPPTQVVNNSPITENIRIISPTKTTQNAGLMDLETIKEIANKTSHEIRTQNAHKASPEKIRLIHNKIGL